MHGSYYFWRDSQKLNVFGLIVGNAKLLVFIGGID